MAPTMAPPRKRTTRLGEAVRDAREALGIGQRELGSLVFASSRQVSRWENGAPLPDDRGKRLLYALSSAPEPIVETLADALGLGALLAPPPPPPPDPRATFDALILAAAEDGDMLPRHLRAFGIALLRQAESLGVSTGEAAGLLAREERAGVERGDKGA